MLCSLRGSSRVAVVVVRFSRLELGDAIIGEQDLDTLLDRSQQALPVTYQADTLLEVGQGLLER
jgi:hypothetical protein